MLLNRLWRYGSVLALFWIFFGPLQAQTLKAYERAGDRALLNDEYYAASQYYKEAIKINGEKTGIIYKYAHACRSFSAFQDAEKAYALVARSKNPDRYPQLNFWRGTIKKHLGKYQEAEKLFTNYLAIDTDANSFYHLKAKQEILACEKAPKIKKDSMAIGVEWLDESINSPYSEFGPHQVGDSLYYSSMRFSIKDKKTGKERFLSKLMLSEDFAKPDPLKSLDQETEHTANSTISPDGNRMYFTRCVGQSVSNILCTIYLSKKEQGKWGTAERLGSNINIEGYTSTHPNIGYDSTRGQEILFFSSNRPDGEGKMDLWYSLISPGGDYGEAVNPGSAINSIDDEITPFFHKQSQSLYFSSNWHAGLGGHDIFNSRYKAGRWTIPRNIGYPLNSSNNDVYFTINNDNSKGYLSSNRLGSLSLHEDEACCNDIYSISLKKESEEEEIEREVKPKEEKPADLAVIPPKKTIQPPYPIHPAAPTVPSRPVDKRAERFERLAAMLPVTLYFHNDEPDSNTMATSTRLNYETHYLWYYSMREEYKQKYSLGNGYDAERVEDFFKNKVRKGYEDLYLFSELLLEALMKGEKIRVSIKGFTSPRSPTAYNHNLAQRRTSSGENFFKEFKDGVFLQFLKAGRLFLVETPFGETTSPAGISDSYKDRRNSIYSVEASRERRIEVMQVERF